MKMDLLEAARMVHGSLGETGALTVRLLDDKDLSIMVKNVAHEDVHASHFIIDQEEIRRGLSFVLDRRLRTAIDNVYFASKIAKID